jgi:hypothetical protein
MGELAKILGLGAPVAAAGAIYWLFSFLDKKASDEANQAVASWMKGESYRRIDLGKAVIGAFDNLYGTPLFRWKALYRSAILSILAFLLWYLLMLGGEIRYLVLKHEISLVLRTYGQIIIPTIIADYLSLYVIRQCLKVATRSVLLSILISMIFGFLAISILVEILLILNDPDVVLWDSLIKVFDFWQNSLVLIGFAPAFLVHLWLPLFLVAALINSGSRAFFRVAGLAQRFIKHGDEHPFDAIGIVAAILVFVVTMIWKVAVHFSAPETSQKALIDVSAYLG